MSHPDRYRALSAAAALPGALAEGDSSSSEDTGDLQLFARWTEATNELKRRGLIRSTNRPVVGDYAETLVARFLPASRPKGPDQGYDLIREDTGARVQVKARRDPAGGYATHFDFGKEAHTKFDEFVGIVFDENFVPRGAWSMPSEVVSALTRDAGRKRRLRISDLERAVAADSEMVIDLLPTLRAFLAESDIGGAP